MKKALAKVLFLVLVSFPTLKLALAQEPTNSQAPGLQLVESLSPGEGLSWFWYITAGAQWMDTEELSSALRPQGFDSFSKVYPALGVGLSWVPGRWQLGLELRGAGLGPNETPLFDATVNGSILEFLLGYHVVQSSQWFLAPTVGFGVGNIHYSQRPKNDFQYDPANPARGLEMNRTQFTIDLGVGGAWLYGSNPQHRGLLGLRTGYVFSFGQPAWRWHDAKVLGAPDSGFSGFYVNVTWGGGSLKGN